MRCGDVHCLNLCLSFDANNSKYTVVIIFFTQLLNKYLKNEQTRYELFMKIQTKEKLQEIDFERLAETWSYYYSSLKKILQRYIEIKNVLNVLIIEDVKAIGLLEVFSSFQFILILYIMKKLLNTVHCLSCKF